MKIKFYLSLIFKRFKLILRLSKIRYLLTSTYFFRLDEKGNKIRANLCAVSDVYQNEFYGIGDVFKDTVEGVNLNNVYIEHGFYLYSLPDQYIWPVDKYICMSSTRAAIVSSESGRKTLSVGPYIHYVDKNIGFHPAGDYILYIPMHEIESIIVDYDEMLVINSVIQVANNFGCKPVVCLYYKDYENKIVKNFWRRRGFIVLTCGSRYDQDHLLKIKSLIENSKLMISNGFGTHYIYALFLNIPTQIIDIQVARRFSETSKFIEKLRGSLEDNISPASKVNVYDLVAKSMKDIRNDTKLARKDKADLFGFNDTKTKQEISFFLGS